MLATLSALALISGTGVGVATADPALLETGTSVVPTEADAPAGNTPALTAPSAANAFQAPTCENTTGTPTSLQVNLTGDRLESYNSGNVVPMYGNNPESPYWAISPICGVREVQGQPVAEWMYCTDAELDTCSRLNEDGDPTRWDYETNAEVTVGPMLTKATNSRLSEDNLVVVGHLLQHGIDWEATYPDIGTSTRTDNTTQANRQALQYAIWCITDDHSVFGAESDRLDCQKYLGTETQRAIIDSTPDIARVLELSRTDLARSELAVGETAKFALETDFVDQSLTVSAPAGAKLEVCEGEATLRGSTLTVADTGEETATIVLCVTANKAGTVALSVSGIPEGAKLIHWNQSDPECQIFATFDERKSETATASVTLVGDDDNDDDDEFGSIGSGSLSSDSLGAGSLGGGGAGSLALGSLALGSAGLGSLALGVLGDTGSSHTGSVDLGINNTGSNVGSGDGTEHDASGSVTGHPSDSEGATSNPTTNLELPVPAQSSTPAGSAEQPATGGQVQAAEQAPKGAIPSAINAGGAALAAAAESGVGVALALLLIGGLGAALAVRRVRR